MKHNCFILMRTGDDPHIFWAKYMIDKLNHKRVLAEIHMPSLCASVRFDGMDAAEMTIFMSLPDILLFVEKMTNFCRLCASCAEQCQSWKTAGKPDIKDDAAVLMTAPAFIWERAGLPGRNFFFSRVFLPSHSLFEKAAE